MKSYVTPKIESTLKPSNYDARPYFSRVFSVRYRCSRCRYGCRTEVTEVSGTGIDVVPVTEVSGIGIDVAPKLPKCPVPVRKSVPVRAVPVSMSYRTYRSVRYRY